MVVQIPRGSGFTGLFFLKKIPLPRFTGFFTLKEGLSMKTGGSFTPSGVVFFFLPEKGRIDGTQIMNLGCIMKYFLCP